MDRQAVSPQCRGQVETAAFRRYRLPQYADIPRTEVHCMEIADAIGLLGAKSMSESPFNPVALAFANALRDATRRASVSPNSRSPATGCGSPSARRG